MQNHKKVIPFRVSYWQFYDYSDAIEDWYQRMSDEGRDMLDSLLKNNSKVADPRQWIGCKMLQGECKKHGIWEWKFFSDGCQQRLLGVFGEDRKTAIFLIGCSHKGKVYQPPECLVTAIKRAKHINPGDKFRERQVKEDF